MTGVAASHPAIRSAVARGKTTPVSRLGTHNLLLAVVLVLHFVGVVMVLSASAVQALDEFGSTWGYFKRQVAWSALGLAALLITSRIDYRQWLRFRVPLLMSSVLLLVAVLIPGVGLSRNGSSRWISMGPVSLQPSELAKLSLLVWVAHLLARAHRRGRLADPHGALLPAMAVTGLVAGLVLVEPDLGTTVVLASIVGVLLWVSGIPLRWMVGLGAAGFMGTLILGLAAGYRRARLLSFLDPWADPQNAGYQIVQSLVGLGTGGLTGVGLGAGRSKWGFLPNAHTDFIYAIVGEELGFLGAVAVLALFVALAVLGIRAAARAPDRVGMLLAAGVTAWILVQAFINIGAVIGVLPITGVPLPFVSFGGTALVVTMAATGILVNVARQGRPAPVR